MAPTQSLVLAPKPGIQRDGTRLSADGYIDGQWVRFQNGRPRKIWGYRSISSQVTGIPRQIHTSTRSNITYTHTGSTTALEQFQITTSGGSPIASSPVDRTPVVPVVLSADTLWQFDTVYDPVVANVTRLVAHPGANLTSITNTAETPLFWGDLTATSSLTPMSLPVNIDSFTVASTTASITSGSSTITVTSATGIVTGQTITGTGIAANTYVQAINGTTVTMSQNATATNASASLTFSVGGVSGGLIVLHPYLVAYSSDGRVLWSTSTNPNDFWGSGSGEAFVTEQKIVRGMLTRGGTGASPAAMLWSANSVVRMYFVGGAPVFAFDTIADDITVLSSNSIVEVDGQFLWPGVDRFYVFNGVVKELPNNTNSNWFFENLNFDQRQKVFGFRSTRWGEVWWCYPHGTNQTEPNRVLIYNYRENFWFDTALPNSGRSCAVSSEMFPYPILGGVDTDAVTLKYKLWQHNYGRDEIDGSTVTPIQSYFETNDISLAANNGGPNRSVSVMRVEPDFEQTGDLTMTIKGNYNARSPDVTLETKTFADTAATPADQTLACKSTQRQVRFRFESNVVGGDYWMGKTLVHIQPGDGEMIG